MDNTLKCELLRNQQVLAIILTNVTQMTLYDLCYKAREDKIFDEILFLYCRHNSCNAIHCIIQLYNYVLGLDL